MKKNLSFGAVAPLFALLLTLAVFFTALGNMSAGRRDEGRRQLEDALRRAAVACYASEGIYPPNVSYLEEHYGIQIDRERYTVMYEAFASNLMPDVTVLENRP